MVESTALEMRHTGNCIGGSNPSLSARYNRAILGRWRYGAGLNGILLAEMSLKQLEESQTPKEILD